MIPPIIAFEGVDGAGKSTVLKLVAEALRERGHAVFLPREGKHHASIPARRIRQLTRDAENLDLSALAELALYCAREAQVLEEMVIPARRRGDIVLLDRSLLTPLVIGIWGRGLARDTCEGMTRAAANGLEPSVTLVFDVHARTSRLRKQLQKIREQPLTEGSRKGLAGSGFKERIRAGYLTIAREKDYPVFHAERATPQQMAERVLLYLESGTTPSQAETREDAQPNWQLDPHYSFEHALEKVPAQVALVLSSGLIAGRALRARQLKAHPQLVAWSLDAEDPLRNNCMTKHPEYALRSWARRPFEGGRDYRCRQLTRDPAWAISSLKGLRCFATDELRRQYMSNVPGAVLRSLSGREDAFAEDLRLGCWSRGSLANQASSLVGCSGANAWRLRERLLASSVRRGLDSLRGVTGERADTLLAQYAEKAPKVVLLALAGRSDCVAHDLRQQLLNLDVGREVVASLRGLDDSTSWRLRERCHSRYPSTVIRSLHGISASEPSIELRRKCEQAGQGDLHTLRRSCGLDEHHRQVDAASWSVARTSKPIELQETA